MQKVNKLIFFIFFLLTIIVFKSWFFLNPLSSGDWSFNFNESIKIFTLFPYSWNFNLNAGLGGTSFFILPLSSYFLFTTSFLFNILKIPWVIIEKLVWFWPFLVISIFSSYLLFKKLFSSKFALLSSLIYLFNTYILMIVGGGQMGIAIAYAVSPFVLYIFIKTIDFFNSSENNFQFSIFNFQLPLLAGFVLSILVMFDLRISYVILLAVFIYWLLKLAEIKNFKQILKSFFTIFAVPGIVTLLLHSFWIIPIIANQKNPIEQLGPAYFSLEAVKFFSFAKFENAISLLHPNWPENIFGKTGFLKPEFLILPIFAYSSLLFITNSKLKSKKSKLQLKTQNFKNILTIEHSNNRTIIIFFVIIGLLGAFLAKGTNEPFGEIYLWMFTYIPGFNMFRDPSKWYILVAISYSILIPFTIWRVYELLKLQSKFQIFPTNFFRAGSQLKTISGTIFNASSLFLLVIVFYLLALIRPALLGQLTGTFKTTSVPSDYIKLERFLSSQNSFSRALWIPTTQRFGYYSNSHPAIPAQNLFKTVENTEILKKMNTKEAELLLQEASVKYVVIPFDSQGEIFLKDRKYSEKLYMQTVKDVSSIPWLKEVTDCSIAKLLDCSNKSYFGKLTVFEVSNSKDHFWTISETLNLNYKYISPVEYKVTVENAKKGDKIIFSESYDASWIARDNNTKFYDWPNLISSNPYNRIFNSFTLRKEGDYSLMIYYYPQILVNIGMIISGVSLLTVLVVIFYLKKRKA